MAQGGKPVPEPSGSITGLFELWRGGNETAFAELVARFRLRLLGLARSALGDRPRRVSDADDALQSALVSFWEKADAGGLAGDLDRNDLWNILGLITVRKARRQQAKERALKRGGGRVSSSSGLAEFVSDPAAGHAAELLWSELLDLLDEDLRGIAALRLLGHKNLEIARELGCTERKVERKLNLIRAIWRPEVERWES